MQTNSMAIPDFQTIMKPLLEIVSSGEEFSSNEINDKLAKVFNLSEAELSEFVPSGQQRLFQNRVAWAKSYLKMANLVESPKRNFTKITRDGLSLIKQNPVKVNLTLLKTLPGFINHKAKLKENSAADSNTENETDLIESLTPEEKIGNAFNVWQKNLSTDLLLKLKSSTPTFFEQVVVDLIVKMGYGGSVEEAGTRLGRSGDEGIDGIIKEDKLGLDLIYLQAKKWEGTVGRPEIQKFLGALISQGAKKGVFITTGKFSREAIEFNPKVDVRLVLIDGNQLTSYMIEYGLGVKPQQTFVVHKIDVDYFEEGE